MKKVYKKADLEPLAQKIAEDLSKTLVRTKYNKKIWS